LKFWQQFNFPHQSHPLRLIFGALPGLLRFLANQAGLFAASPRFAVGFSLLSLTRFQLQYQISIPILKTMVLVPNSPPTIPNSKKLWYLQNGESASYEKAEK
jgi:hypothetical protein